MLKKLVWISCLLPFMALTAQAQTKVLKIVVPYPPGGSPDSTARVIGEKIQQGGKYSVVVDNRPGAGGTVAVDTVKNAPPDGLTLLLADSSTYSIAPNVRRKATFDPLKDLKPVSLASTSPIFLIAKPETATSVKELVDYLKRNPDSPYGSSGYGTAHHLAMELFKQSSGLKMTHVPYKGASQTAPAVASGEVIATFAGLTLANAFAQGGKVKILAIAEPKRSALAPNIPTIAESGLPGYSIVISLGFLANAKTPDAIVKELNEEIAKAVNSPDVKTKLNGLGVEPASSTPQKFGEQIAAELKSFGSITKAANIQEE
ncbi:MAG: tripartite tricarboxylate transporter substrate binding protein [Polaromonas sp.]|uniref:Bug family tripartite tricarboxylate transporter substrate binding protein n=1 Tax=Polaromonas sp. TaxID=1869339 RepID=UPI0025E406F0|nr:tripartite tricarboxylate transporter substrate-binding protein [Polaromonas sp.]MBI2727185.1 tripartite tricarboxylate transporter substrate binding protein [Polaromonas sp.]